MSVLDVLTNITKNDRFVIKNRSCEFIRFLDKEPKEPFYHVVFKTIENKFFTKCINQLNYKQVLIKEN
jgi:hypothetical protein